MTDGGMAQPGDLLIAWWGDYPLPPDWTWWGWPYLYPGGLAWMVVTGEEIGTWPLAVAETARVVKPLDGQGWSPDAVTRECQRVMDEREAVAADRRALPTLREDLRTQMIAVKGTDTYADGYVRGLSQAINTLDRHAPWVATEAPPPRESVPGFVIEPNLLRRALADPGSIVKRYGYWNQDSPAEYREKPDMEPLYLWQSRAVAHILAHPNAYPEEFTSRPPIGTA